MYEQFFSFSGSPFRLAPDPKFFFGSKSHNKAMAYLHYGLRQAEGFIVITGEIGAGKSMLIGHLMDQLDRSSVLAANLVTPNIEPEDLLSHILSAFRVEAAGEGKAAEIEAFEDFLFDQMNKGRRVLLVVDEAQNLPMKTIEELRVLSNLEYEGTPLFQVFLVGQPDFRDTMARADMEQLRQRVIASYHLDPMPRDETEKYIEHRLSCVGWDGDPKFSSDAYDAIHAATGGLPRKIHKLGNRVLLYCSVEGRHQATSADVNAVLADMAAEQQSAPTDAAAGEGDAAAVVPAAPETSPAKAARTPARKARKPDFTISKVKPIYVETNHVELHVSPSYKPAAPAPKADAKTLGEEEMVKETVAAPAPEAIVVEDTSDPSTMSVFDRLRAAKRAGKSATPAEPKAVRPPKPATLDEVATAIAAARPVRKAKVADAPNEVASEPPVTAAIVDSDASSPDDIILETPVAVDGEGGWKKSVVLSINDTREELKRAHQSVTRLRRQLTEIDRRRRQRRVQISASLDRAESLLVEFQNAWR